jgi:hypothetical protein
MNCSRCGNSLAPDAHFCPRCGAKLFATPPAPVYPPPVYPVRPPRVAGHLQALGVLWAVYAGYRLLTGTAGLLFVHGFFGSHMGHDWSFGWSPFGHLGSAGWLPAAFASLIASCLCAAVTAFALLTRQPWGRIVAIIFAILALFHPVLGTVLGIYTLWVLAPAASGLEYEAITHSTTQSATPTTTHS